MTADWRATLERVAEKLAGARAILDQPTATDQDHYIRTVTAGAKIRQAHTAVRGLLAEPQPDERALREAVEYAARRFERLGERNSALLMREALAPLAEPQVNPSEAKDMRCWVCTKTDTHPGPPVVMWDSASADSYRRAGWDVVEFAPAGLLAEGEESREP